ncbi:hypothetical protein [Streptomyces prasinus]|uniref:hypothetical protein n=1 Tax=Streptomyces prasinus TaxID=67345 RepID=UPI0036A9BEC6
MVTAANPAVAVEPPVVERVTDPLLGPLLAVHLWRTAGTRHRSVLAGLLGPAAAGDAALLLTGPIAFAAGTTCFPGTSNRLWPSGSRSTARASAPTRRRAACHRPGPSR